MWEEIKGRGSVYKSDYWHQSIIWETQSGTPSTLALKSETRIWSHTCPLKRKKKKNGCFRSSRVKILYVLGFPLEEIRVARFFFFYPPPIVRKLDFIQTWEVVGDDTLQLKSQQIAEINLLNNTLVS